MRRIARVGLLAIGVSTMAASRGNDAGTTVKIYVLKNIEDRNLNVSWAQNIASQIFENAGVRLNWRLGEPRRGEDAPIVIDLTADTPKTLAPGTLACAQVYEGVHIRVFWDRLQNTVSGASPLGTFLLAHVMAHEITHVLERIDRHSESGLMKASWTKSEIEGMGVHPLSLAFEDVQLIRQGLLKRVTQKIAGHIGCG